MDPRALGRKTEQRLQVVDVGVHAAVRDEPQQVDVAALSERGPQRRVLEERAVRDRAVDPLQVLVEDVAGADRQVPDLGVAHLARRQPYRLAGGLQRRVRVLAPEPVEHRRVGEVDRVAGAGRRAAPAVEDDEDYWVAAALQIASNDSTSSDAPPTRAPSTVSCGSSSAAFSGFTEPP